ncbi:MAG: hypothetical protein Q4C95_06660 [Planctomycetia bacterium]|nr:hypothetical protein [Planctomycetia bacterium]
MPTSLFQYEMLPTTWFYISGLMILAIFFRFNRFWSIRNLDIVSLILFGPGFLYIAMGNNVIGYFWLWIAGCLMILRLLLDLWFVRRPLLDPNLNPAGLTFACVTMIAFLIPNILINRGDNLESLRTLRLEHILWMQNHPVNKQKDHLSDLPENFDVPDFILKKPGYRPFFELTEITNRIFAPPISLSLVAMLDSRGYNLFSVHNESYPANHNFNIKKTFQQEKKSFSFDEIFLISLIIFLLIGIALEIVFIAHCHFNNIKTGTAAAMVYLLLPYVNQMPCCLDHILPGFLILLAVLFYRRPVVSGLSLGFAASLVFYPVFLLPLWGSYYRSRGLFRFVIGTCSAFLLMAVLLLFSSEHLGSYGEQLAAMFGRYSLWIPSPDGLWAYFPTYYRIPIIALFMTFCFGFIIWPSRKNLATLMSGSALLMLAVQLWMGNQGGLYMAWYLPLLILTILRPNLEDRVASSMIVEI